MIWWWWWWQLKISVLHHASCHLMHGHKKLDWLVNSLLTTRFLEMLFWEIHSRSCLQFHQGGWVQIWNNKHSEVLTCLSGQAPLTHRRRSINIRPVQVGLVLSEPKYTPKAVISLKCDEKTGTNKYWKYKDFQDFSSIAAVAVLYQSSIKSWR